MAKVFINNINTYIGQALFKTISPEVEDGEEPSGDGPTFYGTYVDKDSSGKPSGIKKMLKVILSPPNSHLSLHHPDAKRVIHRDQNQD